MKRFLLVFILVLVSCQHDVSDVTIKGVVENDKTNKSISNVKISLTNWYYGNSPDESYSGMEEITVITDKEGKYNVSFNKSAFLEIKVDKNGFLNFHEAEYITSKKNIINIDLIPN